MAAAREAVRKGDGVNGVVVDTSAVVAIVRQELGHRQLTEHLSSVVERWITAPNALELTMVLEGRFAVRVGAGTRVLRDLDITIAAFTPAMTDGSSDAWRRFGKGRHPAGLNFGDCCTYALAEETGWPILCTGDDFARTDWPVLRPDPADPAPLVGS